LAPPSQTEIDVISLPVVPKEMFCSISSPFRLSPIYVQSWGTAIKNHCHCHQHLRLAKSSSCGFMPTLPKVYFLDNMFLCGPTFLVFLSWLPQSSCPSPKQKTTKINCSSSFVGLKIRKKKSVCACVCVCGHTRVMKAMELERRGPRARAWGKGWEVSPYIIGSNSL
jgi:hypothetical protein